MLPRFSRHDGNGRTRRPILHVEVRGQHTDLPDRFRRNRPCLKADQPALAHHAFHHTNTIGDPFVGHRLATIDVSRIYILVIRGGRRHSSIKRGEGGRVALCAYNL